MTAYSIDLIKGFGFGLQYVDDYEDDEGTWFSVIIELLCFRVMLFWLRED